MDPQKYDRFLKWMVENGILFSKSVEIRQSQLGGIGVFAVTDIQPKTVLLQVPKSQVLSPSTCGIANLLYSAGLDGMVGLTVAYIFEKCQGSASPWFEFLETIEKTEPLPRFWSQDKRAMFVGTELEALGGLDSSEIEHIFESKVLPFIQENEECFPNCQGFKSLQGYIGATQEVCSRAFEVDVFRGISLVPGACLFNHAGHESVHFESRAEVCDVCGDEYCEHIAYGGIEQARKNMEYFFESEDEYEDDERMYGDDIGLDSLNAEDDMNLDEDDDQNDHEESPNSCEILSITAIAKGDEIFNTYGYHGNGVLLARYGFAIWDNPHETVTMSKELVSWAKALNLYSRVKWWSKYFQHYLFESDNDSSEAGDEFPEEGVRWQETVEIMSTGYLSNGLIKLLKVLTLSPNKFLETQLKAKKGNFSLPAADIKKAAITLINKRLARYKDDGMSSQQYEKLLKDNTDPSSRLILIVRGTEKLVLERARLLLT